MEYGNQRIVDGTATAGVEVPLKELNGVGARCSTCIVNAGDKPRSCAAQARD
jgi:hypothetical protein